MIGFRTLIAVIWLCKPKKHAYFLFRWNFAAAAATHTAKLKTKIHKCQNISFIEFCCWGKRWVCWLPMLEFEKWNQHLFGANVDLIGFLKQTNEICCEKKGDATQSRKTVGIFNAKSPLQNWCRNQSECNFKWNTYKYLIFGQVLYLFIFVLCLKSLMHSQFVWCFDLLFIVSVYYYCHLLSSLYRAFSQNPILIGAHCFSFINFKYQESFLLNKLLKCVVLPIFNYVLYFFQKINDFFCIHLHKTKYYKRFSATFKYE